MCSCFSSSASLLRVFHMASVSGEFSSISRKLAALSGEHNHYQPHCNISTRTLSVHRNSNFKGKVLCHFCSQSCPLILPVHPSVHYVTVHPLVYYVIIHPSVTVHRSVHYVIIHPIMSSAIHLSVMSLSVSPLCHCPSVCYVTTHLPVCYVSVQLPVMLLSICLFIMLPPICLL